MTWAGGGLLGRSFPHLAPPGRLGRRGSNVLNSQNPRDQSKDLRELWVSRMQDPGHTEADVPSEADVISHPDSQAEKNVGIDPTPRPPLPAVPRVGSPTKLEKDEQTKLLKHAREKSKMWMNQATSPRKSQELPTAPIDTQTLMYKQLTSSRNRLSSRLSSANKYISFMERKVEDGNTTLQKALESTNKVLRELTTLSQMAQTAAAGTQFGVDRGEALERMTVLQRRIKLAEESLKQADLCLNQAIMKECTCLDELVPRKVPLSWYGVAVDVRVMGSFDNWSRGVELSTEDVSDSVFTEFTTDLYLSPGTYEVKFVVDGEWRTAPHWPTVEAGDGSTNNVIVVE